MYRYNANPTPVQESEESVRHRKRPFSTFGAKLVIQAIFIIVGGIPLWIFLFMKAFLAPTGFWQNLVMYGIGFWILGGIQVILGIIFLILSSLLWFDK